MARTPQISAAEYGRMLAQIKTMGYDLSKVRKSPQRWPEARVSSQSFRDSCRGEPGALGEGNSGSPKGPKCNLDDLGGELRIVLQLRG